MVNGILDCWDGTGDSLIIGDLLVAVEGDIKVYLS